jgi:hypothetical protein
VIDWLEFYNHRRGYTFSGEAESARAKIIRAASLFPIERILFLAASRIPFVFGRVAQEPACPACRLHALDSVGRLGGFSQEMLQLGEHLLDRVEIGTVGRQEE